MIIITIKNQTFSLTLKEAIDIATKLNKRILNDDEFKKVKEAIKIIKEDER